MSKEIKPATTVAIFGLIFGALCAYGGYSSLNGLQGAPELWGFKRSLALGVPLAVLGGLHLVGALLQLLLRKPWTIYFCMFNAVLLLLFYIAFEASTIGPFGARLVSVLAYGLPVFMILQGKKALNDLQEEHIAGEANMFGGKV
jgi:hypothetical protein